MGLRSKKHAEAKPLTLFYLKVLVDIHLLDVLFDQLIVLFLCFEILCQVECSVCQRLIFPGDEVKCSVRDCTGVFHLQCAKEKLGLSSPKMFKCPQHVSWI